MSNLKSYIKKLDLFGFPITLKFNKKGDIHKSLFGGILSIIFYIFIIGYFFYCFNIMVNHLNDNDHEVVTTIDLNSLGFVNYNQTGFMIFAELNGTLINSSLSIDELSTYLDITFN